MKKIKNFTSIIIFDDKYEFILLIEYLLNKIIEDYNPIIELENFYKSIK